MPTFQASPDAQLHYLVDDFADPWRDSETILLLHGNAESGMAWYGWVPSLARRFRVVRPDMRGFGASTPMPRDFPWTLDIVIDDFVRLMDSLGVERFHLVGAKIGGTIARAFAARRGERVMTLTVVGTPPPMREGAAERAPELADEFERDGVEHWARRTMAGRLGGTFPAEGRRVVDQVHGTHRGLDANRFYEDDRLRRHPGGPAKDPVPDFCDHDRRKRASLGRRDPGVAAANPEFDAYGPTRQFLPRRGEPCRALCRRDPRLYRPEQRRLNPSGMVSVPCVR